MATPKNHLQLVDGSELSAGNIFDYFEATGRMFEKFSHGSTKIRSFTTPKLATHHVNLSWHIAPKAERSNDGSSLVVVTLGSLGLHYADGGVRYEFQRLLPIEVSEPARPRIDSYGFVYERDSSVSHPLGDTSEDQAALQGIYRSLRSVQASMSVSTY